MKPIVKFKPDANSKELTGYVDEYIVIDKIIYCMVVVQDSYIHEVLPHQLTVIGRAK